MTEAVAHLTSELKDRYRLLSEIARRRGFFWGSFEIYGGLSGFLDLGPLGTGLKREIEDTWREFFLRRHGFVEISTPIITPHRVLEASGHVENFKDPMTECTNCHRRFRADQLIKEATGEETEGLNLEQLASLLGKVKCPECGGRNEISPRQGPIRLREFTIMDFELFFDPDNPECPYLDEVREDQMSIVTEKNRTGGNAEALQVSTGRAVEQGTIKSSWAAYFMALSKRFLSQLGIQTQHQRFFEKLPSERAHYSAQTFDHEVKLDRWGWVEVAGFAYRTDYDIRKHMQATGADLRVFKPYDSPIEKTVRVVKPNHDKIRKQFGADAGRIISLLAREDLVRTIQDKKTTDKVRIDSYEVPIEFLEAREEKVKETGKRFIPHVVEPSFGVERLVYSTMEHNLRMREDRLILSLPFKLAPIQASVYPLVNKDGLVEKARSVHDSLAQEGLRVEYDDSGSIGRRYARADEAGIPLGITIDYDTMKDDTVTLRDRDTWAQIRTRVAQLEETIHTIVNKGFPRVQE
ncbi:glycine--tRNA ligase [Candidatus Bathyarchaeota archaeon]|nr:MAG: glycine--tRNA ligase [Candidatus Bathyarchaeota archaeon]